MLGPVKSRDLDRPVLVSLETLVPEDDFYRQVEQKLELAIEVVLGNEGFERGNNGAIKMAAFGWTEHK